MSTGQWVVIGIVVVCVASTLGYYVRTKIFLKEQRSQIDEAYDWLQGYRKDEDL